MRTPEEREAEAQRNRRLLLQSETAAVGLLLQRRNEVVSSGVRRGLSAPNIAHRLSIGLAGGISRARVISRATGINRAREEIAAAGEEIGGHHSLHSNVRADINRSHRYANNYAAQWLKKADGNTVASAAKTANAETLGSLNRIAVTESSQAYSEGRAKALEGLEPQTSLLKVWDAQLDKHTCPICSMADGTIVGIKESFPQGVPGAIHPFCRCTWQVLTFQEHGHNGLITPKEPGKVISLPPMARPQMPAPAATVAGGRLAVEAETKAWAKTLDRSLGDIGKDGGAAARKSTRELLSRYGFVSKDTARLGGNTLRTEVLDVGAYHHWDGSVVAQPKVVTSSRAALRKIQLGIEPNPHESDALCTLIHEELHGASAIHASAYEGAALSLEEATTELAARRITADLTGFNGGQAYEAEISGLRATIRKQTKVSAEKFDALINDGIVKLKGSRPLTGDPMQHIDNFVESLKLTAKQRAAIAKDLKTTEWWKPVQAKPVRAVRSTPKPKVEKVTKAEPRAPPKTRSKKLAENEGPRAPTPAAIKRAQEAADKLAEKQIKASLKTAGVKASGDVRGALQNLFGRIPSPEEIRGALGVESLSKLGKFQGDIEFSRFNGISFRGSTLNGQASITRKIVKTDGKVVAKHESLYLSKSAQGQKLGAAIVREQISAYEKLGVGKVSLNSAEVGRYYWPKIGFDSPEALEQAKPKFEAWLQQQGVRNAGKLASAPANMRDLATLQLGERKLGKEFLLSNSYGGDRLELDLAPGSHGLGIFKREIGVK